jgi:hypothetical protein
VGCFALPGLWVASPIQTKNAPTRLQKDATFVSICGITTGREILRRVIVMSPSSKSFSSSWYLNRMRYWIVEQTTGTGASTQREKVALALQQSQLKLLPTIFCPFEKMPK